MNVATHGRRAASLLGALALMVLAAITPAHAQRFTHMFGDTCHEYGFSGVHTPDGGYIAVGGANSQNAGGGVGCGQANEDIYIVKLNSNGTLAWSKTIDINGGNDVARDVIVSQSVLGGYLVTGWTDNSGCTNLGRNDLFILRISNTGNVTMFTIYGTPDHDEMGFRIIECVRDINRRRFIGDIVVAGIYDNLGSSDALLLRVSLTGGPIFQKTYDGGGSDRFFGVTEARLGTSAGDLIACGESNSYGTGALQGLAVRTTPSGTIGASPTGVAVYGSSNYTRFSHVQELSVGLQAGNLVFCGDTFVNGFEGTYVKKTAADPCTSIYDAWFGNITRNSHVETWSIREIRSSAGGGLNNGNLIIAGLTEVTTLTHPFMLEISPGLAFVAPPVGVGYRVYGATAGKGYTADPVVASAGVSTPGFFLTATGIAPAGGIGAGSLQMYLVKTDNLGAVNCNDSAYAPDSTNPNYSSSCPSITITDIGDLCAPDSTISSQTWADTLCNDSLGVGPTGGGPRGKLSRVLLWNDGMELYPNPVASGTTLTVATMMRDAGKMTVIVTDLAGRVVHRSSIDAAAGHATGEVRTDGWRPGTYLVKIESAGRSEQKRIVIER